VAAAAKNFRHSPALIERRTVPHDRRGRDHDLATGKPRTKREPMSFAVPID